MARGQAELAAALTDESSSSWPEAHYLAPLHPVIEWAADRALANLGRNQIFAVRGDTDEIAVLLQGMLTDARGHAVAASWMLARFPDPDKPAFTLLENYPRPADALTAAGAGKAGVNAGDLVAAGRLTRYVRPAVEGAYATLGTLVGEAERATRDRVDRWVERTTAWEDEAETLMQRQDLRDRRRVVLDERDLAQAMRPERRLVRPLLLVMPRDLDLDVLPPEESAGEG